MVQQWRGPPWNAPIWPMIPLLLNRSIEVAALCLKNVFTSITVMSCQSAPTLSVNPLIRVDPAIRLWSKEQAQWPDIMRFTAAELT